jgi:outer membrane lipoprotein-sorting protein
LQADCRARHGEKPRGKFLATQIAATKLPAVLACLRLFFLLAFSSAAIGAETQTLDLTPIKKWLVHQDRIRSLSADFTQTRAFHSLRDPLVSHGKFWFVAPSSFRWEIGDPPKMLAVRKKDSLFLVQPQKKRAEKYNIADLQKQTGAAIFNFPLAKDFADFQRQFEVRAIRAEADRCHVEVMPRDPMAKKFLTELKFDFDPNSAKLYSFEMHFKEGSSMRNDFTNVQMNPKIDSALFNYDLDGFKVSDGK